MNSVLLYVYYTVIVWIIAYFWLFLFKKLHILDRPGHDRIPPRTFKVPNFQWIFYIIWLWLWVLLLFPGLLEIPKIARLLYIATGYGVFNFINDIIDRKWDMTGLPPLFRLIVQIAFIGLYVRLSGMYNTITIFWYELYPEFGFLFSWFRILWFINAINFFDWSHAMTAGVTSIGYTAVALIIQTVVLVMYNVTWENLALMNGITQLCIISAISCFIYVMVEFKPSWVLRDCGISFIGFVLWALSLLGGAKIWTMFLVLFLPICDSIWVFLNRVLVMKKNPMKWDYTHLHHRLMKLWLRRSEVRWPVRGFTLTMLLIILLLWAGSIDKMILFAWLVFLFFSLHIYLYWYRKLPFELLKKEKKQDNI
jgi:UDP-N-acetylmuramyl pentapeptide phosphotransferase/UDP-N-acetylglucosamine-1-phosphate transferase